MIILRPFLKLGEKPLLSAWNCVPNIRV